MWSTYLDWALTFVMFLLNIHLFVAIFRSKEACTIYLFYFIYVLIIHDCLYYSVTFYHDIPSYFQSVSLLSHQPLLTGITIVILACQWFFHLFFLLAFSFLHFFAVFYPLCFRRFNIQSTVGLILFLYCLTAVVIIPLFTSCCGYIYYPDQKYWFFDYNKPWTELYQVSNYWLQVTVAVVTIVISTAIVIRLYLTRKSLTTSILGNNSGRTDTGGTGGAWTSANREPRRAKNERQIHGSSETLGPEVRLAISFLMLSVCWLASTLSFNFLMGTDNTFLAVINLVSTYMNRGKWIVYCLGNKNIWKRFFQLLSS